MPVTAAKLISFYFYGKEWVSNLNAGKKPVHYPRTDRKCYVTIESQHSDNYGGFKKLEGIPPLK
jgi:hypothetical protein